MFTKKITMLEETVEKDNKRERKLSSEIEQLNEKLGEEMRKNMYEKENNKILANNLYQIKEKSDTLQSKYDQLEAKIKSVAPYL